MIVVVVVLIVELGMVVGIFGGFMVFVLVCEFVCVFEFIVVINVLLVFDLFLLFDCVDVLYM